MEPQQELVPQDGQRVFMTQLPDTSPACVVPDRLLDAHTWTESDRPDANLNAGPDVTRRRPRRRWRPPSASLVAATARPF